MHDIIFYIFASVCVLSALFIAFSGSLRNSIFGFTYFILGISGLLSISNSQLLSLVISLVLTAFFFIGYITKDLIFEIIDDEPVIPKDNIFSLLVISMLTAIMASLLGSARWQASKIDLNFNSFGMIFTEYLPVIFVITLLASAMIPVISGILEVNESKR